MKSGDYLSSRRLTASTFGVKELNFCVRNGNRWILFAIITAIAIYLVTSVTYIYSFITFSLEDLQLHSTFSTNSKFSEARKNHRSFVKRFFVKNFLSYYRDQALDLLVSVSYIHYCTYTSDLSTLLSARSLTSLRYGIPYLEASFTLRCFQRLSQPHSATLPCRWRDNRCTVGAFIPVLSY